MENKVDFSINFTIFSDGKLYNRKTNNYIKWHKDTSGYYIARISENGEKRLVKQHRLLAQYFIQNPKNKTEVNHINGVKYDNHLENLEWVTRSENTKHAYDNGLIKVTRPCKKIIDSITNKVYESVKEAAELNNITKGHLSDMLNGRKRNTTNLEFFKK